MRGIGDPSSSFSATPVALDLCRLDGRIQQLCVHNNLRDQTIVSVRPTIDKVSRRELIASCPRHVNSDPGAAPPGGQFSVAADTSLRDANNGQSSKGVASVGEASQNPMRSACVKRAPVSCRSREVRLYRSPLARPT